MGRMGLLSRSEQIVLSQYSTKLAKMAGKLFTLKRHNKRESIGSSGLQAGSKPTQDEPDFFVLPGILWDDMDCLPGTQSVFLMREVLSARVTHQLSGFLK